MKVNRKVYTDGDLNLEDQDHVKYVTSREIRDLEDQDQITKAT